jgi:hypothetical protein
VSSFFVHIVWKVVVLTEFILLRISAKIITRVFLVCLRRRFTPIPTSSFSFECSGITYVNVTLTGVN